MMDAKAVAKSIAGGHAYQKHIEQGSELPSIKTKDDFSELIERIIRAPSEDKKLTRGRRAFWDDATQVVVIVDANSRDLGTAFVPKGGKAYFDELIGEETA